MIRLMISMILALVLCGCDANHSASIDDPCPLALNKSQTFFIPAGEVLFFTYPIQESEYRFYYDITAYDLTTNVDIYVHDDPYYSGNPFSWSNESMGTGEENAGHPNDNPDLEDDQTAYLKVVNPSGYDGEFTLIVEEELIELE